MNRPDLLNAIKGKYKEYFIDETLERSDEGFAKLRDWSDHE